MIEYSLGRQAYTLGESDVAVEHFLRLLRKDESALGSQGMVLEDLALAYEVTYCLYFADLSDSLVIPNNLLARKISSNSPYLSLTSGLLE
jgi:hypothetical protein